MFPHWYWFMNAITLSINQLFNACTMIRTGNGGVSTRAGLLFGPNKSFLFLSKKLMNFQSCSLFSKASFWSSLTSFSQLSFGELSHWTMTEVWLLLVPLRAMFPAEMSWLKLLNSWNWVDWSLQLDFFLNCFSHSSSCAFLCTF